MSFLSFCKDRKNKRKFSFYKITFCFPIHTLLLFFPLSLSLSNSQNTYSTNLLRIQKKKEIKSVVFFPANIVFQQPFSKKIFPPCTYVWKWNFSLYQKLDCKFKCCLYVAINILRNNYIPTTITQIYISWKVAHTQVVILTFPCHSLHFRSTFRVVFPSKKEKDFFKAQTPTYITIYHQKTVSFARDTQNKNTHITLLVISYIRNVQNTFLLYCTGKWSFLFFSLSCCLDEWIFIHLILQLPFLCTHILVHVCKCIYAVWVILHSKTILVLLRVKGVWWCQDPIFYSKLRCLLWQVILLAFSFFQRVSCVASLYTSITHTHRFTILQTFRKYKIIWGYTKTALQKMMIMGYIYFFQILLVCYSVSLLEQLCRKKTKIGV